MWDDGKERALARFKDPSISCVDDVYQVMCQWEDGLCTSLLRHSVYTAMKLHDLLLNALWPAVRESNPFTAFDTMDDWLERLGWVDCFETTCRNYCEDELSPFEVGSVCNVERCVPEFSQCLQDTVKHNLIMVLTRLSIGTYKNITTINDLIEPLGAVIATDDSSVAACPLVFTIGPTTDTLHTWQRDVCVPQADLTCQAYFEPNACYQTGLPQRIYPGVLAAECIVRSLLSNCGLIKFNRLCEVTP